MRWAHLLVLLGACYRSPADGECRVTSCSGGGDDGGPGQEGGGGDGGGDGGPNQVCAGVPGSFLQTCFDPVPPARTLSGTFDTGGVMCDRTLTSPEACIVVVDTVPSGTIVQVTGARALVLWSASTLTVDGQIDAASHSVGTPKTGPGSPESCTIVAGAQGGGGPGGAFAGSAGNGGDATGAGGTADSGINSLDHIRAGCPGGPGGLPNRGLGGNQGGAVYLMAHDAVVVGGIINASGGGGFAAGMAGGGGGGGSGGLIGLDAPTVTITQLGHAFAVGGGGAGGGGSTSGGTSGKEASCCAVVGAMRASSSDGTNFGGSGATGTSTGESGGPGNGGAGASGGGGGGGSTGFIKVFFSAALTLDGEVNPPPSN